MKNKEGKTMLSEHFSLYEMVRSGTAISENIDNTPTEAVVSNLRDLCINVLEPLRRRYGAIIISSGYRCEELNRAVGGVKNSQHMRGEAADIHTSSLEQAERYFHFIKEKTDFDQLLLERKLDNGCCWIHVSYTTRRANRQQAIFDYMVV